MTPRILILTVLPILAAAPALSRADAFPDQEMKQRLQEAQRFASQAGDDLLRSLHSLEQAIPKYGLPYLDEGGNIIIPRVGGTPRHGVPVPEAGPGRV
jgi:hypothetical protein